MVSRLTCARVVFLLALALLVFGCVQPSPKTVGLALGPGHFSLRAEVADTPALREKGLMGRSNLSENRGMLFVFNQSAPRTFWMANTPLPLEIVFIDDTGVIVDIQEMAPCTSPSPSACPVYVSAAPARYALEVNAGFAGRHGVQVGQSLPAPNTASSN